MNTPNQPDKFDLESHNVVKDKHTALKASLPEVFTEGDKIDFERLKLALGESVDVGKERYGISWPGKADCFKTIQQPSMATLVPVKAESVAWDTTENVIIEGDNLEVLKLLQKSYLGRVKMIFIDPPYNTGNDFIYPDNYTESLETYLRYTGQVNSEGRRYSTNTEADGRFHSKWLNMMYPRLYLARNLLQDNGVIFITIDDHEVENLRRLLNEIFGEENFLANIVWQKRYVSNVTAKFVSDMHDHVLVFGRNAEAVKFNLVPRSEEQLKDYKNPDADERGLWRAQDLSASKPYQAGLFEITGPTGLKFNPPPGRYWRCNPETYKGWLADNRIWFGKERTGRPMLKAFLSESQDGITPNTWWEHSFAGHNKEATLEMKALFDGESPFDTPKPVKLLRRMIELAGGNESLILDFFAGSGTTGQAVLEMNKRDGGNRRFVLVQLPEPTGRKDFPTIAEITKERVRRAIKKLNEAEAGKLDLENGRKPDRGFKVFKLQSSNFKTWNADAPRDSEPDGRVAALEQQLEMHVHHIVEGRSQDDLLFELLLKSGFPLTTPIETLTLADQIVFSIAEGAMLICLEKVLTPEVIKEMAARKPERVVCLDEGFAGNDQLKTNAVQTMKTKGITSFRTV